MQHQDQLSMRGPYPRTRLFTRAFYSAGMKLSRRSVGVWRPLCGFAPESVVGLRNDRDRDAAQYPIGLTCEVSLIEHRGACQGEAINEQCVLADLARAFRIKKLSAISHLAGRPALSSNVL